MKSGMACDTSVKSCEYLHQSVQRVSPRYVGRQMWVGNDIDMQTKHGIAASTALGDGMEQTNTETAETL